MFSGGCFFAAASTEFDGRPGPVRDKLRDGQQAWLAELAKQAKLAGADDPEQLVFEVSSLVQGANAAYQLFGDERAFARARTAIERMPARLGQLLERGEQPLAWRRRPEPTRGRGRSPRADRRAPRSRPPSRAARRACVAFRPGEDSQTKLPWLGGRPRAGSGSAARIRLRCSMTRLRRRSTSPSPSLSACSTARLGERVHAQRRRDRLELARGLGRANHVARPQAGHAVHLRERPEDEERGNSFTSLRHESSGSMSWKWT